MSTDIPLTEQQRDDLVRLLALYLPRPNMLALVTDVLGKDAIKPLADAIDNIASLARGIVDALHREQRIGAAVTYLRQNRSYNKLLLTLNHILNGNAFGSQGNLQAFVNEYEPFLNSADLQRIYPLITHRICAVGLGDPFRIVGSGFLIAPDLVMTNFHVLADVLQFEGTTNSVQRNGTGKDIYFFFDYLSGPPPTRQPDGVSSNHISVKAAEQWLVHARTLLPHDGTSACPGVVNTEYDYAVIRLAERIGERPVRSSGGQIRGWMSLPDDIDVVTAAQRILVFQHPGAAPQQFDIGDFVRLDPSGTRVWYSVSAARGSSGGAAVDKQGNLFALHNAEVNEDVCRFNGRRVNQGIRIDYIHHDLTAIFGFEITNGAASGVDTLWSLKDDPNDLRPVIGRTDFHKYVSQTLAGGEGMPRAISVMGPPGSGRHFTIELLQRIIGPQIPIVMFTERELQACSPQNFVKILVQELGLSSTPTMPEQQSTEAFPRWLRIDLPQWLLARLAENHQNNLSTYPRWIVINTLTADNRRLLWAEHLRDFLVALLGESDRGQPSIQLTQLRWLFIGETVDALLLQNIPRFDEDLSNFDDDAAAFAECVTLACTALNKPLHDDKAQLMFLADAVLELNTAPRRQVLANLVRRYLKSRG